MLITSLCISLHNHVVPNDAMKVEVGAGLQTTFFGDKLFRDSHVAITYGHVENYKSRAFICSHVIGIMSASSRILQALCYYLGRRLVSFFVGTFHLRKCRKVETP